MIIMFVFVVTESRVGNNKNWHHGVTMMRSVRTAIDLLLI